VKVRYSAVSDASCSARVGAAFPSATITTRKFCIMASRAEDSQQTLVRGPVIRIVSNPPARNLSGSADVPG
jgi:hypothetical protein